jgi:hypothetical protein
MAYTKTKLDARAINAQGSTGAATAASMPNHGVTFITNATTAADTYTLQPPVAGCEKRLIFTTALTTSTELPIVRTSTTGADDITIVGATTGINQIALTTARVATQFTVVDMVGRNSTSWIIVNVFPNTSLGFAAITLSSA